MTTQLIEILKALPGDTLLSDGASTWAAENLVDALQDAIRDGENDPDDRRGYTLAHSDDGRAMIHRLDDNGYMVTPALYVEQRADQ